MRAAQCDHRSATGFHAAEQRLDEYGSETFAARVVELARPDPGRQIDRAFRMALSRPPSPEEVKSARATMAGMEAREALVRLGLVMFNLNEFIYLE